MCMLLPNPLLPEIGKESTPGHLPPLTNDLRGAESHRPRRADGGGGTVAVLGRVMPPLPPPLHPSPVSAHRCCEPTEPLSWADESSQQNRLQSPVAGSLLCTAGGEGGLQPSLSGGLTEAGAVPRASQGKAGSCPFSSPPGVPERIASDVKECTEDDAGRKQERGAGNGPGAAASMGPHVETPYVCCGRVAAWPPGVAGPLTLASY